MKNIEKRKSKIILGSLIILVVIVGLLGYSINKKKEAELKRQEQEKFLLAKAEKEKELKDNENILAIKKNELEKYSNIEKDKKLIVVSKINSLPDGYVAEEIIYSGLPFTYSGANNKLNKEAAEKAQKMFNDAKKDGVYLLGLSGYRDNSTQTKIYYNNIRTKGKEHTQKYSAAPGQSEHETGLAIDIVSSEHKNLTWSFENTKAFRWLRDNAENYGYILRYPKDKVEITQYEYEPWHYRYVGIENAKNINETGLCLDEYVNWVKSNKDRLSKEIKEIKENIKNII